MSEKGLKELAKVIEFLKKKKIIKAEIEYQSYSKMPSKRARDYINALNDKVLKGEVDIGNIPDSELELFNRKPSPEDVLKRKSEIKRNVIIAAVAGIIFFTIYIFGGFDSTSSSGSYGSSSSTSYANCGWCGDRFKGKDGYTHMFGNIALAGKKNANYACCHSRSCATKHLRNL